MALTVRDKASNRTARSMSPLSPKTSVGGKRSVSAYSMAMISGPIPHGSPIVIAIGKASRSDILFHLPKCISQGGLAAEAARLGHQWQRSFPQQSHDRDA